MKVNEIESEKRCLLHTFQGMNPLCKNWDNFYESCKCLWYQNGADACGNPVVIHPTVKYEHRWLISRVGCASFDPVVPNGQSATPGVES